MPVWLHFAILPSRSRGSSLDFHKIGPPGFVFTLTFVSLFACLTKVIYSFFLREGALGVISKGSLIYDGANLTITLKQPPRKLPVDTRRLFVKGLSDKTTSDALQSYMEVVSGVDVLTAEFGDEACAIVTFNEDYGKLTFLAKQTRMTTGSDKLSYLLDMRPHSNKCPPQTSAHRRGHNIQQVPPRIIPPLHPQLSIYFNFDYGEITIY